MTDAVSSLLIRQLDAAAARHKVLAHNIANYGTPGYKPQETGFAGELGRAQAADKGAGAKQAELAPAESRASGEAEGGAQGAPVQTDMAASLETQMARLADNTGRFSTLARLLTIRERAYESAVRGR